MANVHKPRRNLELTLRKIRENKELHSENIKLLLKINDECSVNGISPQRTLVLLILMRKLMRMFCKPVKKLTKEELKGVIAKIEKGDYVYIGELKGTKYTKSGTYSENTKANYKIALRKMVQIAYNYEWKDKEVPKVIKGWLVAHARRNKLKDPVILTEDEIINIMKVAKGFREKALVSFMYESGCRTPDELLNIKIKDIEFDKYGMKAKLTSGKVGSRVIRLVSCVGYVKNWLKEHPDPDNIENPFFTNKNNRKRANYEMLIRTVKEWVRKAGITKRVIPYTFRHTRATHLAPKLSYPVLCSYFGWEIGSKSPQRYINLSTERVDDAILAMHGIKMEGTVSGVEGLTCSKCAKLNTPDEEYCVVCESPLTEKAKMEADQRESNKIKEIADALIQKRFEEKKQGQIK